MTRPDASPTGIAFWRERFGAAQRAAGGVCERTLAIGRCRVRLRFAGEDLIPGLLESLSLRLSAEPTSVPHLTVHLWDVAGTGISVFEGAVPSEAFRSTRSDGATMAAGFEPVSRTVRAVSPAGDEAWWQVQDARDLHIDLRGSPLRDLLHVALRRAGMPLLHAGAVGRPDGGVLLVGPGGVGKSTTALSCLGSRLRLLSEDYTAISLEDRPFAEAIYGSSKLNDDSLGWMPALAGAVSNPDHGPGVKNLLHLHRAMPEALVERFPLKAVLVVGRNTGSGTRFVPTSRAEALRALAPSTLLQMPGSTGLEMGWIAGIVRALPSFRLLTGTDLAAIPPAIEELIDLE